MLNLFLERAYLIPAVRRRVHWVMGGLTMFCMYSFILSKLLDESGPAGVVFAAGGGVVQVVVCGFGGWCSE